jgi:hypothetical protein
MKKVPENQELIVTMPAPDPLPVAKILIFFPCLA